MAETNFKIFNEANTTDRTFNDSEYMNATQRQNGVIPGMALSRLHNKLYLQVSAMAKAIADFIVVQGHDCYDNDVAEITANLQAAIENVAGNNISEHNTDAGAHSNLALTVNDSLVPTKDTDTLVNLLSGLGKRFRDVTGKGNWYDAPDISLATLATLVSNLASGSDVSWSGSKFTNSKLGISGLMAQNGYIQFGPNFGGLIVQWGLATYASLVATATFPISFSNTDYIGIATGVLEDDSQAYIRGILRTHKTTSSCLFRASETGGPAAEYVVIGR